MSHAEMLSAVGLIRTPRRRGFGPACRPFQTGDGPQEIGAPALIALLFLIVAALAWVVTVARMSSTDDMTMGLGPLDGFIASWTVMMAAMMRFARQCHSCSLIGASNLVWMIVLTAIILIYKLAPAPSLRWATALSTGLVALGVLYAAIA